MITKIANTRTLYLDHDCVCAAGGMSLASKNKDHSY